MDAPEPDTPFAAMYQAYLDKSTPFITYRWVGTGVLTLAFALRIVFAQGWYIGQAILTHSPNAARALLTDTDTVAYSLGIYLLNLFLAFLTPKFDPSLEQDEGMEAGESSLPTKEDSEFRPFVRRLPEFKFWYSATRAIAIGFACSWSEIFNLPVFWPVLVVYWLILFCLTSEWAAVEVEGREADDGR
ncbi:hypothetical protein LTR04_002376, partial [Oleoguttula sp. CCFEE 6159]